MGNEFVMVPRRLLEQVARPKMASINTLECGLVNGALAKEAICKILDKPAEQHQGEPVAYRHTMHLDFGLRIELTDESKPEDVFGRPGIDYDKSFRVSVEPLYTHADAGEVERLRNELGNALEEVSAIRLQAGGMQMEIDELGAKLAERDALLRGLQSDLYEAASMAQEIRDARPFASSTSIGAPYREFSLKDARSKAEVLAVRLSSMADALSASAEPSAPKCETCTGTGMVDDGEITCSEGGIPYENGPVKCMKDCPDCKPSAPVERDERAALRLVDILAREMKHWPDGCDEVFQTGSGRVIGIRHDDDLFSVKVGTFTLNTEGTDPHVTHDLWEQARTAMWRNTGGEGM